MGGSGFWLGTTADSGLMYSHTSRVSASSCSRLYYKSQSRWLRRITAGEVVLNDIVCSRVDSNDGSIRGARPGS